MSSPANSLISSPASAFRADVAAVPGHGGFGAWLPAASLLHHAAASAGAARRDLLFEAVGAAIDLLGDEHIEVTVAWEWPGQASQVDALFVLIEEAQQAGAFNLANVMADDLLLAASTLSPLVRGRLRAIRARLAWKLGAFDDAADRYEYVISSGKRLRSEELIARGENGLSVVAQLRGNYPAVAEHAQRALALGEAMRIRSVARVTHFSVMISAAKLGRFDEAMLEGWKVFGLSRGRPLLEADMLQNFGQMLLETGHDDAARAAFAAVVARRPALRVLLPALSGLALASARKWREATVEWATSEVWTARALSALHHETASALVESAAALAVLGRTAEARRFRNAGQELARRVGLHELDFQADAVTVADEPSAPVPLRAPATRVLRRIEALEPEQLPRHVVKEAAPA